MGGFMGEMMYGYPYGYPFAGMFIWMGIIWILQIIIAYLVYQDANRHDRNPLLWAILVVIPMIGWLFLVIYVIIRETGRPGPAGEKPSARAILDERFARGEIKTEEYQKMKEELNR
jgi:putative membrane protein